MASPAQPPGPPKRGLYSPPEKGGVIVVQGDSGGLRLVATRSFAYGEAVLREKPLLLVPKDEVAFLKDRGSREMLVIAQRLRDASRLAVFAAFCQLPENERQEVLALGVSKGSTTVQDTKRVVGMFLQDYPQLAGAIDWDTFCTVVGVVSDRGTRLPTGERALYRLSSLADHSCSPNAVVETFDEGGTREMRVIAHAGISENEAVSVSFVEEEVLLLPLPQRKEALAKSQRMSCACVRCTREEVERVDAAALLQNVAKANKDMDEPALSCCMRDLDTLDVGLPFGMVGKARMRSRLGQLCEGREADGMLNRAVALYEQSIDETAIVLGQKGLRNIGNVRKRLDELRERMD